jgi:RHS repeat-associated protein
MVIDQSCSTPIAYKSIGIELFFRYCLTHSFGVAARIHDDDGNLTDDGTKQFVWDAESRLIEVKNTGGTVATYAYDYQARRISKTIGSTITSFVYDGWNPIAEFSGTTLSKSYTWGMDLSGSMQGAGGVGGLLAVAEGATTHYPVYDGNGNATQYVDSTGSVVASYEYDAFGQATPSTTNTKSFTHQFSTKQLDEETGLNYYGYRYYDSSNGRWLGRDLIQELGGLNISSFVANDVTNSYDYLGLDRKVVWGRSGDPTAKGIHRMLQLDNYDSKGNLNGSHILEIDAYKSTGSPYVKLFCEDPVKDGEKTSREEDEALEDYFDELVKLGREVNGLLEHVCTGLCFGHVAKLRVIGKTGEPKKEPKTEVRKVQEQAKRIMGAKFNMWTSPLRLF